ncbi:Vms1/Ankzf1 family peptidyl-tRNA hydrolase [Leifsonia sp. SIMBA_070]|uniref:baeRF2 domain-containing protein n=2 Tax=Bacillati TaxID=1783272 RepID=UPI00397C3099
MSARDILAGFLAEPGPWTTVLADISRDMNDPKRTVDLRHRSLLQSLEQQGAPRADIDAVEGALMTDYRTPSPCARFIAVRSGQVEVDEVVLGAIPRDGWAWHGPVIDPLPLLARDAFGFHALLVEASRDGATIWHRRPDLEHDPEAAALGEEAQQTDEPERVDGTSHGIVHKVPSGGWAQLRYQHYVEDTWRNNERAVAERIGELADRYRPRLIMVAGDLRAVELLTQELPQSATDVLFTEQLEASAGDEQEELFRRFEEAVARVAAEDETAALERIFTRSEGEGRSEALGIGEVVDALEQSQADTVVVTVPREAERTHEADRRAIALDAQPWIASAPEQDYGAGELGIIPASVAIARAAVLTDARVIVVSPGELPNDAPAAALLRWPVGPPQSE